MPRSRRKQSESSIYHVINRGEGRQIIFENNADRAFFMSKLATLLEEEGGSLLAWCLMDNHFHFLVIISHERLKVLMHRLQTSYAGYFNRVHEHVGAVFGGRFKSEPVDTDEYLMTVVRYIHDNPRKGGVCSGLPYQWSSYREYCGEKGFANTDFVLGVFDGVKQFKAFHDAEYGDVRCLDIGDVPRRSINDEAARLAAEELLGKGVIDSLKRADRQTRDRSLVALKESGLSVRQIQRLTGISLGVISNAGRRA